MICVNKNWAQGLLIYAINVLYLQLKTSRAFQYAPTELYIVATVVKRCELSIN